MHMAKPYFILFVFYKLLTSYQEKIIHHGHRAMLSKFKYFRKMNI